MTIAETSLSAFIVTLHLSPSTISSQPDQEIVSAAPAVAVRIIVAP